MPNVSDNSPKGADMPTAEQARDLLIAVGTRRSGRVSVKEMLATAARDLRIGFRRARAIYHREARLIGADEWESIKRCAAQHDIKEEWGRAEHASLAIRLRECAAETRRGPDVVRRQGAEAGEEGRRSGAGAAA